MSVQKDEQGRRWVAVEAEVEGTPEEVWKAISSGPGVSSWFVPTEREEGVGGKVVSHFGPGMDSVATMTAWNPPHNFAAESGGLGPGAPPMATEWSVEARDGGKCVVRVVHSLFASTDDWDNQLEAVESGWPAFFQILRLYVKNFAGQPCSAIRLLGAANGPKADAWKLLSDALGLSEAAAGARWDAAAELPRIGGEISQLGEGKDHFHALLLLNQPGGGIGSILASEAGPKVYLQATFFFYGTGAAEIVARDEAVWTKWMGEKFPLR